MAKNGAVVSVLLIAVGIGLVAMERAKRRNDYLGRRTYCPISHESLRSSFMDQFPLEFRNTGKYGEDHAPRIAPRTPYPARGSR